MLNELTTNNLMDNLIKEHFGNIQSKDKDLRYNSFQFILDQTRGKVAWADEIWDLMTDLAKTGDNHQRTIAVQILSNLSKSVPTERILRDLPKLVEVTRDKKFVTARHSLQCLWKIGIINKPLEKSLTNELIHRF